MTNPKINTLIDAGLWLWHGANVSAFAYTISPAQENIEWGVKILGGIAVAISAMVATYFTIRKNTPKKKK